MYVSDYGFAVGPSSWTAKLGQYEFEMDNNWMYMGLGEWTITRVGELGNNAFALLIGGIVFNWGVTGNADCIRPTFSLSSSTVYESGQGTAADPIRIN